MPLFIQACVSGASCRLNFPGHGSMCVSVQTHSVDSMHYKTEKEINADKKYCESEGSNYFIHRAS